MLDRRLSVPTRFLIIMSIAVLILLASTQRVYAVGGKVGSTTCHPTFGGTWNGVDTCTITNGITVSSGQNSVHPQRNQFGLIKLSGCCHNYQLRWLPNQLRNADGVKFRQQQWDPEPRHPY